jgi:hypothetical protein
MALIWTSQFLEKKAMYAFNPNRGKSPGSFEKVKQDPHDFSPILNYEVIGRFGNQKEFLLTLYDCENLVDKAPGIIESKGPNKEYYALVNKMRKEAAEIVKKRKEEEDKQPPKGID